MLRVFWENHDPTQGMRQGNDVGTQYRSAVYTTSETQADTARRMIAAYETSLANAGHTGKITTEVTPLDKIYFAEEYELAKYPAQEAHYFVNILRKQRAGQHTPFLVSPEGSMAYSNMLNDLLLNPATLLCGLSPMPFSLPEEVKILTAPEPPQNQAKRCSKMGSS